MANCVGKRDYGGFGTALFENVISIFFTVGAPKCSYSSVISLSSRILSSIDIKMRTDEAGNEEI